MKFTHNLGLGAAVLALLTSSLFAQGLPPGLPTQPPKPGGTITMEQMVAMGMASRYDQTVAKASSADSKQVDLGLSIAKESKYGFNAWSDLRIDGSGARVTRIDRLEKEAPKHLAAQARLGDRLGSEVRLFGKHLRYALIDVDTRASDGAFDLTPPPGVLARETQIPIDRSQAKARFTHRVEALVRDDIELTFPDFNGRTHTVKIPSFKVVTLRDKEKDGPGTYSDPYEHFSKSKVASMDFMLGPVPITVGLWAGTRVKSEPRAFVGQNLARTSLTGKQQASLSAEGSAGVGVSFASAGVTGRFDIGKMTTTITSKPLLSNLAANTGTLDWRRDGVTFSMGLYAKLFGKRWDKSIAEDIFSLGSKSGSLQL